MRTSRASAILLTLAVFGCGPGDRAAVDAVSNKCSNDETRCLGNTFQNCIGTEFTAGAVCEQACSPEFGCVECVPGSATCNGETSSQCLADGSGYQDVFCDPVQGMECGEAGLCEGVCSPLSLGNTYFGCEYYPTITGNTVANAFDFAIVIANTALEDARVTIEGGALTTPINFVVPASAVVVRTLPWVAALKLCTGVTGTDCIGEQINGASVIDGAYHVRSNVPVTVYQFNPLQYTDPSAFSNSFSNDASLLFPTTAWRNDYYVASWPHTGGSPSQLAVTAWQDNTTVTIDVAAGTLPAGGAPGFAVGEPQAIVMNSGDVLELATSFGDLTGSRVTSDKPVQVIGGHYCATVPSGAPACDHLEESMFPVEALGLEYIVNAPAVTTIPDGKVQRVRIIATAANTVLTYNPPQAGFPTTIANPGEWVELPDSAASYRLTANYRISVTQYMEGSSVAGDTGDPSMAQAVPVEQFRREYLFHAPTNYQTNYVDVTARLGSIITLDGTELTNPITIDGSWQLYRVTPLGAGPLADGNHRISAGTNFGISVYGYGKDTSYWYPGGLDLNPTDTD